MLRSALLKMNAEHKVSIRTLGKRLGYKQATVLSHMASGRIPIPLDRAPAIAREVGLSPGDFLAAAVAQRSPEAYELLQYNHRGDHKQADEAFINELALIASIPLGELNDEQKSVLREVVSDPRPRRRWLGLGELSVVELLRHYRPKLDAEGLSAGLKARIEAALRA